MWDVDGNRYVDFPMALGPMILGHAWPAVNEAIERQLADGITFTLPHPIELEVAERVVAQIPGAERIRFGKTGSDANSAAIRIARAVTGRDGVIVGGYHGWHDWFISTTTRDLGVPEAVKALTSAFDVDDLASLDAALAAQAGVGETAAVILEPSGLTEPAPAHLQALCDRARAAGALVMFDEIITGFRLAPGGAQERYGVRADLATFGKALGNGMPISAIAGPAEYMDRLEEIFFSGTHGGETLSMAAARATLDEMTGEVYAGLESKGLRLRQASRPRSRPPASASGSRSTALRSARSSSSASRSRRRAGCWRAPSSSRRWRSAACCSTATTSSARRTRRRTSSRPSTPTRPRSRCSPRASRAATSARC